MDSDNDMLRVRDLMQQQVATLDASDTLDLPDEVMRLGRARHFPVMSGGVDDASKKRSRE